MDVAILDLDGDRAETEAQRVTDAHGVGALGLAVDVADPASVVAAAQAVSARLVASISWYRTSACSSSERSKHSATRSGRWLLNVNVIGSARVARAFIPLLREADHGRLAFTTSSSILDPASRLGAYQASKFAVWGLAETLRLELAEDGIGVSVIFPSGMLTRHLETSEAAQPATSVGPSPTRGTGRR